MATPEPASFQTRGGAGPGWHVITPENRAYSVLPELTGARVTKLVTPRRAPAQFAQYLLELEPGGGTEDAPVRTNDGFEHFFYGLAGEAVVVQDGVEQSLAPGRFAYLPPGSTVDLVNRHGSAELLWYKRRYEPVAGVQLPPAIAGHRDDAAEVEFAPNLWRSELIGNGDVRLDFTIVRMRFAPGAEIGMVEVHQEEHGLWMTAGRGLQLLATTRIPLTQGDFAYMAPYCPQGFAADPAEGAEYLLYKDAFRDGC